MPPKAQLKSAMKKSALKAKPVVKDFEEGSRKPLKRTASEVEEDEESEEDEQDEQDDEGDDEQEEDSSEESSESDYEDLGETTGPAPKKRKKDSEAFSKAITAILGSRIKAHDSKDPILVRSKKTEKELEEKKLEAKAKHALAVERRTAQDKDRVRNLMPKDEAKLHAYLDHEKTLRKTAQRGVVKLFNAILGAQKNTQATLGAAKQGKLVKAVEKEAATDLSKEQFLDLIRSG